jgi:hypothetical protein
MDYSFTLLDKKLQMIKKMVSTESISVPLVGYSIILYHAILHWDVIYFYGPCYMATYLFVCSLSDINTVYMIYIFSQLFPGFSH